MTLIQYSIRIKASPEDVFTFHTDPTNLLKITPSFIKVFLVNATLPGLGQEIVLKLRPFYLPPQTIHIRFFEYLFPKRLSDEQIVGPFTYMKQTRTFVAEGEETIMTDTFEYQLPFGMIGSIVDTLFVRFITKAMFRYRQKKTKDLLEGN